MRRWWQSQDDRRYRLGLWMSSLTLLFRFFFFSSRRRHTRSDRDWSSDVCSSDLLVDFLREDLGLTGTHVGCEHGICGACTILFNGEAARSCIMLAVQAEGAELRDRKSVV